MYNIIKNGNHEQYGIHKYVADTEADIALAPDHVAPGSTIFCIENSKTYILSPQKEWVVLPGGKGEGGGEDCVHDYLGDNKF